MAGSGEGGQGATPWKAGGGSLPPSCPVVALQQTQGSGPGLKRLRWEHSVCRQVPAYSQASRDYVGTPTITATSPHIPAQPSSPCLLLGSSAGSLCQPCPVGLLTRGVQRLVPCPLTSV